MDAENSRTVYTSIAPRGLSKQFKAVNSWRHLGFKVRSVNNPDEIEQIRDRFPFVEFVPVGRTAQQLYGRPLVFLDDIFDAFLRTEEDIFIIINSDVSLKPVYRNAHDRIIDAAKTGIAYGPRVDVYDEDFKKGEIYFGGFDYFFVSRKVIPFFPRTNLAIGATWWDYWIVMFPILKNIKPKLINAMLAAHPYHEIAWSEEILLLTLKEIVDKSTIEFEGTERLDFKTVNLKTLQFAGMFATWCKKLIYMESTPVFEKAKQPVFEKHYAKYIQGLMKHDVG